MDVFHSNFKMVCLVSFMPSFMIAVPDKERLCFAHIIGAVFVVLVWMDHPIFDFALWPCALALLSIPSRQ